MLTRSGLLSAQLRVTIPDAADVVATVANVTLPLEALVALPSMIFGSALRFTEPPPNMWLLDAPWPPVLEVHVQAHRVTVPVLVGDNFGHNDEASLRSETVYYLDVKLEEARGLAAISASSHPTHP